MDKDFYLKEMSYLCNLIDTEPDMQRKKISDYWPLMKHLDNSEFHQSCIGVVREFVKTNANPFPMVSHFLKFCSSDAQGSSVKAISVLKSHIKRIGRYESVDFGDRVLHAVVERFGGWSAICGWSDKEWDINEGRMIESYKMSYQCGMIENEIDHLKGLSEKDCGYYRIYRIDNKTMKMIGSDTYSGLSLISSTYRDISQIQDKSNENTTSSVGVNSMSKISDFL